MQIHQIDALLFEYISDCINLIMYHRKCYPKESFEMRQSFNLTIPTTRHPLIIQYIEDFIEKLNSKGISSYESIQLCVFEGEVVREILEVRLSNYIFDKFSDPNLDISNLDPLELHSSLRLSLIELVDSLVERSKTVNLENPSFRLFVKVGTNSDKIESTQEEDNCFIVNNSSTSPAKPYQINPLQQIDVLGLETSFKYY